VNVHVKVDEKGCVVSAKAISGHPLLRSAAEQTARQAKLKAAKTAEILIFNFTIE
jgi:outer membrane biosynthesis protein TonB